MGWKDLLQATDERTTSPWVGGRSLRSGARTWTIDGRLPQEHGWYSFRLNGRKATVSDPTDPAPEILGHLVRGYLVGDRIVPDEARVDPDPSKIIRHSEPVALIEPGLDRFVRVIAGRTHEDGPLVYQGQEMPLGPEDQVLKVFLDQGASIDTIPGVPPALDAAFRMEVWQRAEAEKRRLELERMRQEEEERRAREERREQLRKQLGDAAGRRELAKVDFGEAARAALRVGGAEYLDHRTAYRRNEVVVRFRILGRRFECTCDPITLRIIDAGICLTAHYDDPDFEGGTKGDTWFTLESLPLTILEADREGKLVVFRHVD